MTWSAESQLDSTTLNRYWMVKYEYNALGKPVVKSRKVSGGSWAVDSYLIWDGDQLLLDLDASGNRKADYVYYPGTIDQPAAQTIGATSVTAIRDHRMDASGNVIGTVDGVAVSQKVSYDAWGTPTFTGNADNRLLWKGLMWEGEDVSLYFVRNRWYDPETGRFLNEDPIGHAGGENLYAFGGNDPVNASDPDGTFQTACTHYYIVRYNVQTGDINGILGQFDVCTELEGGGGLSASGATEAARRIGQTMRPFNTALECAASAIATGAVIASDFSFYAQISTAGRAAFASRGFAIEAYDLAIRNITGQKPSYTLARLSVVAAADATRRLGQQATLNAGRGYLVGLPISGASIAQTGDASLLDIIPGIGAWRSGKTTMAQCAQVSLR